MVTVDFSMLSLATYFVRDHSDAPHKFSDADFIKMLEYLTDNIFVEFGGWIFQQTIGIPKGINCASLLAVFILVRGGVCTKYPPSRQETPRTTIQFRLQIYR